MIKAIVYQSNTGHTFQYAKMLGDKLSLPYYALHEAKQYLKSSDEIIFMGWIFASKISGWKQARRKYRVRCCCGIGAYLKSEQNQKTLIDANHIEKPFFYLRGGIDYHKLRGMKKVLLKLVSKEIVKEKPEMSEMFQKGGNFVSVENLNDIVAYVKRHEI